MRSASPISCLASQRIWRVCSGSLSCAEVIASAAVAAAALVSEAPGDLPPSHGGGQSAGTDSTDSKAADADADAAGDELLPAVPRAEEEGWRGVAVPWLSSFVLLRHDRLVRSITTMRHLGDSAHYLP